MVAGFFVVVFVSVFVVDGVVVSVAAAPVEPVAVELPVEPVDEPEPIDEPEPVEPAPIVESVDDGVVGVAAAGAGVVVDVDVVDVDVALGSVMVPDVFWVSGVFGGSSLPPQATRPAKHAPTNRAEIFMLKLPSGLCPPFFAPTPSARCGEVGLVPRSRGTDSDWCAAQCEGHARHYVRQHEPQALDLPHLRRLERGTLPRGVRERSPRLGTVGSLRAKHEAERLAHPVGAFRAEVAMGRVRKLPESR